jgi:hypothetical protein
MRKLTIILTLCALSMGAFAQVGFRSLNWKPKPQVSTQSVSYSSTLSDVSVLWLRDGLDANYTALSYPLFQVSGLGNRVEFVGLGAMDSSNNNVWAGTGISFLLLDTAGWKVKAFGGWKGFNLSNNFSVARDNSTWVFGLGISIPIK